MNFDSQANYTLISSILFYLFAIFTLIIGAGFIPVVYNLTTGSILLFFGHRYEKKRNKYR